MGQRISSIKKIKKGVKYAYPLSLTFSFALVLLTVLAINEFLIGLVKLVVLFIYIVSVALLVILIKVSFSDNKFLKTFSIVLNPYYMMGLLIFFYALLSVLNATSFAWILIFFVGHFASFSSIFWGYFLNKEKNRRHVVWMHYIKSKFSTGYLFWLIWSLVLLILSTAFYARLPNSVFSISMNFSGIVFLYFLVLYLATFGFTLELAGDIRRYCKAGFVMMKDGLKNREFFLRECLLIFPHLINQFNKIAKEVRPHSPYTSDYLFPYIHDTERFVKVMFITIQNRDRKSTRALNRGLTKIINSLEGRELRYLEFIRGLNQIERKRSTYLQISKTVEISFGLHTWIKRNLRYIEILLFVVSTVIGALVIGK